MCSSCPTGLSCCSLQLRRAVEQNGSLTQVGRQGAECMAQSPSTPLRLAARGLDQSTNGQPNTLPGPAPRAYRFDAGGGARNLLGQGSQRHPSRLIAAPLKSSRLSSREADQMVVEGGEEEDAVGWQIAMRFKGTGMLED
jgi:hypothetical protein